MNIITEIIEASAKFYEQSGKRAKKVKLGVSEHNRLAAFAKSEFCYTMDFEETTKIYKMVIVLTEEESLIAFV